MRTMGVMAATVALAACAGDRPAVGTAVPGAATASARLIDAQGREAGTARASDVAGGLRVTLDVGHLVPGTHGTHVHTVGRCDAPGFDSAGGHWNPTAAHHGAMNPQGPHQGDMPNLLVGSDGRGTIGVTIPGASVAGLLDADGSALVIHAGQDDLMTDPSGNSGARIACGVFAAS